ncbi:MAG: metal-dependent hydrolase [archaeon]
MSFTLIHAIAGYLFASAISKNQKIRWIGFLAGALPDLDGIFIFFNQDLYYALHHELFHPPIYGIALGLIIAFIAWKFFKLDKKQVFVAFAGGFIFHSIIDILFTAWPVKLLWPLSAQEFSYPIFANYIGNAALAIVLAAPFAILLELYVKKKLIIKKKRVK